MSRSIVITCDLCHRRVETPGGLRPSGWQQGSINSNTFWAAHGDETQKARDFCKPACQAAWDAAETEGVAAFREGMRRARLSMQSAVDALAEINVSTPDSAPNLPF